MEAAYGCSLGLGLLGGSPGKAIAVSGFTPGQVSDDFIDSRDHGMAHVEDLIREWAPRLPVPSSTIRAYLTQNIHYVLDEPCIAGIELFYRYAAECGVLPVAPPLRWL